MTTSDKSWSSTPRAITDLERPDHSYLTPQDTCVFFGEYTARVGFEHSRTNDIISNLKKSVSKRGKPEYKWKGWAINVVVQALTSSLNSTALAQYCMVPIPPSKRPDHAEYDDRLLQICRGTAASVPFVDLLESTENRPPAHQSVDRPGPEALYENITCKPAEIPNIAGKHIFLLDDVLCTGASFIAAKRRILDHYPTATVQGVFVARRVPDQGLDIASFFNVV